MERAVFMIRVEFYLNVYSSALNGGENRTAVNVAHASRLRENERDAHSPFGRWWPCEKAA
jgi:hypothetical protein